GGGVGQGDRGDFYARKFELNPPYQRYTDSELLNDLKTVAKKLGKNTITKREYLKQGSFGQQTIAKRFGSWASALKRAGLSVDRFAQISTEELIADIQAVAAKLEKHSLTLNDYKKNGAYSEEPIRRYFGTWLIALENAGLAPSDKYPRRFANEEYFQNIEEMWIALGRQPKYTEVEKPLSKISAGAYENRFGSWRKALEAFIKWINEERVDSEDTTAMSAGDDVPIPVDNKTIVKRKSKQYKRTSQKPSLRLRFRVMQRDNFACRACGKSPAIAPGTVLHIDHVNPWSKGGETLFENLQTLCEICNFGKADEFA
ncbi:MAG: HNH endonuclease, partial [Nitrospirota bacterium]